MRRERTGQSGSPTLVLFPTELEARRFQDQGGLPSGHGLTAICGFGPIAAAARTAQLLERLRPARAFLIGIAGTYDTDRHAVGEAVAFGRVALDGIGAGQGSDHVGPSALGFPQWPGSEDTERLEDVLTLAGEGDLLLLTTCSASASPEEALMRREQHPDAVAEDMEGYAVALACAVARTPLAIVRGFSNEVGDRDAAHWRIPAALGAARRAALELLEDEG